MGKEYVMLQFHLIFLNLQSGIEERHKIHVRNVISPSATGIFPVQSSSANQTSVCHNRHHNVSQLLCR
jgi:hypothetical protein